MARKSRSSDEKGIRAAFRKVCGFICPFGETYNAYGYKVFGTYPSVAVMRAVISASKAYRYKLPLDLVDKIIIQAFQNEDYARMRRQCQYQEDQTLPPFDEVYGYTKVGTFYINGFRFSVRGVSYESRIYVYNGEEREKEKLRYLGKYPFLPRPAVPVPAPAPAIGWLELIKMFAARAMAFISMGRVNSFDKEKDEAKAEVLLADLPVEQICRTCKKFEEEDCECEKIRSDALKELEVFARRRRFYSSFNSSKARE